MVGRIIKRQPELWRCPTSENMDEPPASDVLGDMKSRKQGHARAVRSHVREDLAIVGAERSTGWNGYARSAVGQNPVLPATFTAIGKAIVRGQLARMFHLREPATGRGHQDPRHRPDLAPDRELVHG